MHISGIYHSTQHLHEIGRPRGKKKRHLPKKKTFTERLERELAKQRGKQEFAAHMRRNPTSLEAKLGFHLAAVVKGRLDINPQQVIAGYIVDFYIPKYRLVFEADGPHHELPLQQKHDQLRDQVLRSQGIATYRFTHEEFLVPQRLIRQQIKDILNRARIAHKKRMGCQ